MKLNMIRLAVIGAIGVSMTAGFAPEAMATGSSKYKKENEELKKENQQLENRLNNVKDRNQTLAEKNEKLRNRIDHLKDKLTNTTTPPVTPPTGGCTGGGGSTGGSNCTGEVNVEVSFGSSYQLDPNHQGIFLQTNGGDIVSGTTLSNISTAAGVELNVDTTSMANGFQINLEDTATTAGQIEIRHLNQSNTGGVAAVSSIDATGSIIDAVAINTTAVANNFGISGVGGSVSLGELSVNQCNVGDVVATTKFMGTAQSLTAATTAVGNTVSISLK